MDRQWLFLLLVIHTAAALIYSVMILLKRSHLRKEYIIPIFLVPVFGVLASLALEVINIGKPKRGQLIDLHSFKLGDEAYWKTITQRREDEDLLPVEEAALINDHKIRRRLMLDMLYEDPHKFVDVLMIAKDNEDSETSHYASTTISKIQRDYQLGIQELSVAVEQEADDISLLDRYLILLENYIQSGVLEDYLLYRQRLIYSKALDKKLKLMPLNKSTIIKKIRNSLEIHDFTSAQVYCERLKETQPADEDTWIECVRACVDSKDNILLARTIEEIKKTEINWSSQGKNKIASWLSV